MANAGNGRSEAQDLAVLSSNRRVGEDALQVQIEFEKRRLALYEIHNNIKKTDHPPAHIPSEPVGEHRLFLEDWNKQFEASERNLARKQASCSSAKSDLYQILGLFFVFQGVVVTAVAQTNQLTCHNWYLPFLLSLIVFAAAFLASIQKLGEIAVLEEQVKLEKALYHSLYKAIENLKERGIDFDLGEGQPQLRGPYTKPDSRGFGSFNSLYSSLKNLFSVWVFSYAGGVLFLLCAFSVITLISVWKILCDAH